MQISNEMQILVGVLTALCAYFFGNINTAILISKLKGKDIRKSGSGNPGTMNMIRTFGKPIGALTLVLDVTKGVIPSLLGWLFIGDGEFLSLGDNRLGLYIAGICVELGHIFPVTMKFKGGKGIATVFGVCMVCQPIVMSATFAFGLVFLLVTKVGSLTSFIMIGIPLSLEGSTASNIVCSALIFAMFALTLYAHRSNFVKLFSGNERQVVLKKSPEKVSSHSVGILFDGTAIAE